jgi:hypothetical protein
MIFFKKMMHPIETKSANKDSVVVDTEPAFLLQIRSRERPSDPLISCLVPAFNEEGNIVPMLAYLACDIESSGPAPRTHRDRRR